MPGTTQLLVWLGVALATTALVRPQATGDASAVIVGTVIDAVSGQPVASARVRLIPADRPAVTPVLTGPDGRFAFDRLPAGRYTLSASRPGFLEGRFGRRRPDGSSLPLVLDSGDRRGGVTIDVWPASSISGVVQDNRGTPVPGAGVLLQRLLPGGDPDPARPPGLAGLSDRAGRYRIDGLTPGDYVVSVARTAITAPVPRDGEPVPPGLMDWPTAPGEPAISVTRDGRWFTSVLGPTTGETAGVADSTFATTFFGYTPDAAEATPVTLETGADRTGVDITLIRRPAVSVSGVVTGVRDPGRGIVRLLRFDDRTPPFDESAASAAIAMASADGSFAMHGVPAGDYLLAAFATRLPPTVSVSPAGVPRLTSPLSPSSDARWALMPISVGDRDLSGVTVRLQEGLTVRGTIDAIDPAGVRAIDATLVIGDRSVRIASAPAGFEIPGLRPGWHPVGVRDGPDGLVLTSVRQDGREMPGMGLDVGAEDLDGVVVAIGQPASIEGDILDPASPITASAGTPDATLVVFPVDPALRLPVRQGNLRMRTLRLDDRTFRVDRLPPGEYFVAAIEDAALARWPAPEFLQRVAASATCLRVRLAGGDRRQVVVTVDRLTR